MRGKAPILSFLCKFLQIGVNAYQVLYLGSCHSSWSHEDEFILFLLFSFVFYMILAFWWYSWQSNWFELCSLCCFGHSYLVCRSNSSYSSLSFTIWYLSQFFNSFRWFISFCFVASNLQFQFSDFDGPVQYDLIQFAWFLGLIQLIDGYNINWPSFRILLRHKYPHIFGIIHM